MSKLLDEQGEVRILENGEIRVTLALSEFVLGFAVGVVRHGFSVFTGGKPHWQEGKSDVADIRGALAECAYFKWLGIYWTPALNNFSGPDAPGNVEVRSTNATRPYYKVKDADKDERIVVFIESGERSYKIVGWLPMKAAKQLGKKEDRGDRGFPCLHLEREQLLSMRIFPNTNARSKCNLHGLYPGEGECPMCAALAVQP